tara:strand:- start:4706 stop:5794 length:1089 start_codon:yes stop_codon:yes gene_type:complete
MILFIGPEQSPVTGQSVSFNETYRLCSNNKIILHYSSRNSSVLKSIFLFLFRFIYIFFKNLNNLKLIYITNSRTLAGFFRDAFVIMLCYIFKKKVIIHVHGFDFSTFRNLSSSCIKFFIDLTYNHIDTIIILHEKLREQYKHYKSVNIVVVNNFQNIPMSVNGAKLKIENVKSNNKIKLLFFSNLIKEKGYIDAINATKLLVKNGINVELNIVGGLVQSDKSNNITKNQLIKMIKNYDYINYHGCVIGAEKNDILFNSDILLFPSYYKVEAVPIVIIEAMASACAIITTNHNLLPYLVCSESGIIVEKKSPEALAYAVTTLYNNRNTLSDKMKYNFDMSHREMTENVYKKSINLIIEKNLGI